MQPLCVSEDKQEVRVPPLQVSCSSIDWLGVPNSTTRPGFDLPGHGPACPGWAPAGGEYPLPRAGAQVRAP